MNRSQGSGYLISALLGAIGGGLIVWIATKAGSKWMANTMPAMMQKRMAQMQAAGGCCQTDT